MFDHIKQHKELIKSQITGLYGDQIEKSKGEGSRGGKIIGHTRSGKPIYNSLNKRVHAEEHKDLTHEEHKEAMQKLNLMSDAAGAAGNDDKAVELNDNIEWHRSQMTEKKNKEVHKKHEDGVSHGGFSAKVWNQDHIQKYQSGYGAIYHQSRTPERDKHLESKLREHGLKDDEIAHFLISRQGRHTMDAYEEGDKRVEKDLPSNIKWFKEELKKAENADPLGGIKAHQLQVNSQIVETFSKGKRGEGSRGGRVIGHTKNGKPIYALHKDQDIKGWTQGDHVDAEDFHKKKGNTERAKFHEDAFMMKEPSRTRTSGDEERFKHIKEHEKNVSSKESKDATDHLIVHQTGHYIDSLDPDTLEEKFKPGDKVKYKDDKGNAYSGTLSNKLHPRIDRAYKVNKD